MTVPPPYRCMHVETVARIAGLAAAHLDMRQADLDVDMPLGELGMDSLTLLGLMLEIELSFDVDLDCYEVLHVTTLRHVAGMVELSTTKNPKLLF